LGEELVAEVERLNGWEFGMLTNPDGSKEGTTDVASDKLRIDSIRRDEVPGIHTINWESEADCITITHDAHSRKGFALGAVLAAEYTAKHSGLLTMDDLFQF
jgi:4-hydroxy-tetrahydrodipicolinate reductase